MTKRALFVVLTALCCWPMVTTPIALISGLIFGLVLGCPWQTQVQRYTKLLLQASVVGLGFGIPIRQVLETGRDGLLTAALTILLALAFGYFLATLFKIRSNTTTLISVGTAICGGSAIAAIAPVIRAKPEEMSVSLAAIFSLNAVALFLFPWIGHLTGMSPEQFGLWSALAIHDTSSVVGAASTFGPVALAIATTVKLTRVIWIVPIALALAWIKKQNPKEKIVIPWFILFFVLAAVTRSFLPSLTGVFDLASLGAKQALCVVLFWIGAGLNRESLSRIGLKPLAFAVLLWISLASISYGLVWST